MKKLLILFPVFLLLSNSFANIGILAWPHKASELFISIGSVGQKISLMELSQISQADLVTLTGRRMNMMEKIAFNAIQRKLRRNINPDGTVNKGFARRLEKMTAGPDGFSGSFFLGLIMGPIGVLLCYLSKDEKSTKRNNVKWAWIGCGVWLAMWTAYAALSLS